jgi:predicted metal-dependent phosphoesterase TrpH
MDVDFSIDSFLNMQVELPDVPFNRDVASEDYIDKIPSLTYLYGQPDLTPKPIPNFDLFLKFCKRKILSTNIGKIMESRGYHKFSSHTHSSNSGDVKQVFYNLPEYMFWKANANGIGKVALTDHHHLTVNDSSGNRLDSDRHIRGVEISVRSYSVGRNVHLVVLGDSYTLDQKLLDKLLELKEERKLFEMVEIVRDNNAFVYMPHPRRGSHKKKFKWNKVSNFALTYKLPFEINGYSPTRDNLLTLYYAYLYGLPVVAAPDSHGAFDNNTYTLVQGDTVEDILHNFCKGENYILSPLTIFFKYPIFLEMCLSKLAGQDRRKYGLKSPA